MSYALHLPDWEIIGLMGAMRGNKGSGRNCYNVKVDSTVVIKEVHLPFFGANTTEWFIWNAVKGTSIENVFGACHAISMSGRYLIMECLDDVLPGEYKLLPDIPIWTDDIKPTSFGKNASGEFKLRDYGSVKLGHVLSSAARHRRPWM